jgi:hypothetical protein
MTPRTRLLLDLIAAMFLATVIGMGAALAILVVLLRWWLG